MQNWPRAQKRMLFRRLSMLNDRYPTRSLGTCELWACISVHVHATIEDTLFIGLSCHTHAYW